MKIGVLALQGDFGAHQKCLEHHQIEVQQVREVSDLEGLQGIVLPGGESSVMSRLLLRFGLFQPLQQKIAQGLPVFATCAGLILLSQRCTPKIPEVFSLLPVEVQRNGYGPQTESTHCQLLFPDIAIPPIEVHFIRAPIVTQWTPEVKVLGFWKESPVVLAYHNIFAMTFHPELNPQNLFYPYWIRHFVQPLILTPS